MNKNRTRSIIIVAGGKGSRMISETPKQFSLLGGKPVLMHTLNNFQSAFEDINIILVLPKQEIATWEKLCADHDFKISHKVTSGGESRFHSVKNGLEFVEEKGIVGVHDGVRPFAGPDLIRRCFSEAERSGNAVPCIPVQESMRKVDGEKNEPADRSKLVIIQTPQCFDSEILHKAYHLEYRDSFTDDATVVEASGVKINLVEGERGNIKITYPEDLRLAEALLALSRQ